MSDPPSPAAGDVAGIAEAPPPAWPLPVRAILIGVPLASIAYALDLFRAVGLVLYLQQFLAIVLLLALPATFLAIRVRKGDTSTRVPWYDLAAALVGGATSIYVLVVYPLWLDQLNDPPPQAVVAGAILLVLMLEGLRRSAGLTLMLVTLGFVVVGLTADLLPGALQGRAVAPRDLVSFLGLDPNAMLGLPLKICTTAIVAFVVFGGLLAQSGGTQFFTDLAAGTMGRYRGGSLKMAVVASGLFGSVSGSAVSNVVSTGVVTIPLMRAGGLPRHEAGAVEAVASTGGQLMPPIMGASAFLMAELLEIPYSDIVIAALIPAILYYVALFCVIDLRSGQLGVARIDPARAPPLGRVFARGWHYMAPFAVIIVSLFTLNRQPETAAAFGIGALLVLWLIFPGYGGRVRLGPVFQSLAESGHSSLAMIMIGAAAGVIMGALNISTVGFSLALALVQIADGQLVILLVTAAILCMILGMGLPTVGVYILLAALVAPSLIELKVPTLTAHLFVLYYGMMSMITPPVALAAFAGANIAGADPLRTALSATRLGWMAYVVPFLFVFEPALTLDASVGAIALVACTVVAGIWFGSVALVGFLSRRLTPAERLAFAGLALPLLLPRALIDGIVFAQLAAFAAACALMLWTIRRAR